MMRDTDRFPHFIGSFSINVPWESFHAEDKEVRREGVSLPNTSGGPEFLGFGSIYENVDSCSRDTGHNEICKRLREVKILESIPDKRQFKSVKGFSQINFKIMLPFFPFIFLKWVINF